MISAFDKLTEGTKFEAKPAVGWLSQGRTGIFYLMDEKGETRPLWNPTQGHLAITGAPATGKSTIVRNMVFGAYDRAVSVDEWPTDAAPVETLHRALKVHNHFETYASFGGLLAIDGEPQFQGGVSANSKFEFDRQVAKVMENSNRLVVTGQTPASTPGIEKCGTLLMLIPVQALAGPSAGFITHIQAELRSGGKIIDRFPMPKLSTMK